MNMSVPEKLEELTVMVKENCEKTNEIHFAIFGNERAGVKGMAKTQIEHGKKISEHEKLKYLGLGAAMVSGAGIWHVIKNFLHI